MVACVYSVRLVVDVVCNCLWFDISLVFSAAVPPVTSKWMMMMMV